MNESHEDDVNLIKIKYLCNEMDGGNSCQHSSGQREIREEKLHMPTNICTQASQSALIQPGGELR